MTPNQQLEFLRPAFLDLFKDETPDLSRFLRLVHDVLDPAAGYGPAKCAGDGGLLPQGCGQVVTFQVATNGGRPYGYLCPNCKAVYSWSMCKGPKPAASRVVITSHGSTIGATKSESDSGVVIVDDGTVKMPGDAGSSNPGT